MKKIILNGFAVALAGLVMASCEKENVQQETPDAVIMNSEADLLKTRSQSENGRFTENDYQEEDTYCTAEVIVQPAIRQDLKDISGDASACSVYFTANPTILGNVLTSSQRQDLANGNALLEYKTTTNNVDYHAFKTASSNVDIVVIPVTN